MSRDFSVQPNMIRCCNNKKDKLRTAEKGTQSTQGAKIGRFSIVDDKVMEWMEEKEKRHMP